MNAIVEPAAPASTESTADPQVLQHRWYGGAGQPRETPADYTVLLPTEDEWSRDTWLRATVADALQRNGKVVDEDTLEATIDAASAPGGVLADVAPQWKLHPGESREDGRPSPSFFGYAIALPVATQQSLLGKADEIATKQQADGPAPVDASIKGLQELATENGESDILRTLAAIEAAIQAGRDASEEGERVDSVAVRALTEFATRMGRERDAARIMERYTALRGVEDDAKQVGQQVARVFNGRDPVTGKALNTDQRVQSAFGLLDNGFRLAGSLGSAAQLLGVGGRLASTLIGIAPVGIAIVGFAAGIYGLVKKIRAEINEPQWEEFRNRFPGAEDMEPKQFLKAAMRQVEGMPVDGPNGAATASRIMELLGNNPETRDRYLEFLKGKVEPDSLVDALAAGNFKDMTQAQAAELARASRGHAREFLELEIDDTKRYVRDSDGDRTRGTYLLHEQARIAAERDTNELGGTVDEVTRVGGILLGGAQEVLASFQTMLGGVRGGVEVDGKPLNAQQERNLAAAAAAAASGAGLSQVDQLVKSDDGKRLFVVQGDLQSETRRVAAVEIEVGAAQAVEASHRQREAAQSAASAQRASQQDSAQRGM